MKILIVLILILLISDIQIITAQIHFDSQSKFYYLKGKDAENISPAWKNASFDVSSWNTGNSPFRYGDGTGGTELTDMQNNYSTVYLRSTFLTKNVKQVKEITFTFDFDDGFILWINGEEALKKNAPENPAYNSFSTELNEMGNPLSVVVDATDITLVEGNNTIAVQGFNTNLESSDFYFSVGIDAEITQPEVSDSLEITFSQNSGFYNEPFELTIKSPSPEFSLIYTLDGSNPQKSTNTLTAKQVAKILVDPSIIYNRPETPGFIVRASLAKKGVVPSRPMSKTYIFIEKVKQQTSPGNGWPTQNVNGQIIDLDMDKNVINDKMYTNQINNSLLDIPTISIVTDLDNLFNPLTGIYVNATGHGLSWERFSSVELLNPDKSQGFVINCGLRIRGGWSRHSNYPKHSFRLFFRDKYGKGKLKFPLFENEGVDEFDKIDLRCEQNYSWTLGDRHNTFVREVFSRDTQRDMNQPYTRSRYYHLYLNGMYWGLYQTQERSEARFAESYLGGDSEDYDVIKVNTEDFSYIIEATDGNVDKWTQLWDKCSEGFASNKNYFLLEGKNAEGQPVKNSEILVDIDNLIDYMSLIFYTGNFDAPTSSFGGNNGPNNFYAIKNREDKSQGFTFFCHDAEHAMMVDAISPGIGINENRVTLENMRVDNFNAFHPQWLHFKLTDNQEYRIRFADRVYKHFFNDGVFTQDKALERLEKRVSEVESAVIAESARWGDYKANPALGKDNAWLPEINVLRNKFFPQRNAIVLSQLQEAGLYPSIEPPDLTINGIKQNISQITINQTVNAQLNGPNSGGEIYYTFDGSDPRKIGGTIDPKALAYSQNPQILISSSSILKARAKVGNEWSALLQICFLTSIEDYSKLKITELHYNPVNLINNGDTIDGKSFEFIEFKNTGNSAINLSGLKLDSAISYSFPNVILPPKSFFVVAAKGKWFYQRYGLVASGNFKGNLSNKEEQIVLIDKNNQEILNFSYSSEKPWNDLSSGNDFTLTSLENHPQGNPNDYQYWMPSSVSGGTPFADDEKSLIKASISTQYNDNLNIYYNTINNNINVSYSGDYNYNCYINIYTIEGKCIYSDFLSLNEGSASLKYRPANGVYIIKVETKNESKTTKIVVYNTK